MSAQPGMGDAVTVTGTGRGVVVGVGQGEALVEFADGTADVFGLGELALLPEGDRMTPARLALLLALAHPGKRVVVVTGQPPQAPRYRPPRGGGAAASPVTSR